MPKGASLRSTSAKTRRAHRPAPVSVQAFAMRPTFAARCFGINSRRYVLRIARQTPAVQQTNPVRFVVDGKRFLPAGFSALPPRAIAKQCFACRGIHRFYRLRNPIHFWSAEMNRSPARPRYLARASVEEEATRATSTFSLFIFCRNVTCIAFVSDAAAVTYGDLAFIASAHDQR